MTTRVFDPDAEQEHYQGEPVLSPSADDLDRLEADMRLWVPDFPSSFRGARVLDLGAGRAPLGTLVAQRCAPAAVVSVDICHHRLHAGSVWMQQLKTLSLVCGDAFALPFQDSAFDFVVANSVLHHLPNLPQALTEISRVIRPGGYYIGREPNFDNPALRLAVFRLRGSFLYRAPACTSNEYPLRPREIINGFQQSGCRCRLQYFWRRAPWLRHSVLSFAMSVVAQRCPAHSNTLPQPS